MNYVALLRGVNVGGKNRVRMADLRDWAAELGFERPRTLLASGNLVFTTNKRAPKSLASEIGDHIETRAGFRVRVIVLSARALARALDANPYQDYPSVKPNHLLLYFTERPVSEDAVQRLHAAYDGPEQVVAAGGTVYLHYADGIARSKLTNARLDRLLATEGTTRNWTTAAKLAALAAAR